MIARQAMTGIMEPPAPPRTRDRGGDREPRFAQCMVQYTNGEGRQSGESWLFHIEAAVENAAIAEKKPSFPRLLKKNAYIWGRDTTVKCSAEETVPELGAPCIECVRLFVGGLYGSGVIVPAFDKKNPSRGRSSWTAEECLALRDKEQPPNNVADSYAETSGGGAPGHEPRMSPFCRTGIYSSLFS